MLHFVLQFLELSASLTIYVINREGAVAGGESARHGATEPASLGTDIILIILCIIM